MPHSSTRPHALSQHTLHTTSAAHTRTPHTQLSVFLLPSLAFLVILHEKVPLDVSTQTGDRESGSLVWRLAPKEDATGPFLTQEGSHHKKQHKASIAA